MKTLYVTDLDGTLLRTDDTVSPFTINTVNGLVDKGMLFTYATARSLVSASVVTRGLSARIPVIAYNGAFIYNAETGDSPVFPVFHSRGERFYHIPSAELPAVPICIFFPGRNRKAQLDVRDGK